MTLAVVFCVPPWNKDDRGVATFIERLGRDVQRPGFAAWTANARRDGQLLGFATAWPTTAPLPIGRAYDTVAYQLFPRRVRDWLVGTLEIDLQAVLPTAQGQGIGARLLDAACRAAPDRRAWLLTRAYARGAVRFSRRCGWHQITDPAPGTTGVVVFLSPTIPAESNTRQDETMPASRLTFYNNVTVSGGPAPVRAYIEEFMPDVLDGRIEPGRVFDRVASLDEVPDGYRAMDERQAIKVMIEL